MAAAPANKATTSEFSQRNRRIAAILLSDEKAGKGKEKGEGSDPKRNQEANLEGVFCKVELKKPPANTKISLEAAEGFFDWLSGD